MIRNITLLSIALLCLCAEKLVSQNNTCQGATVACNATFSYPAGVNAGSAQAGPDYGCLGSQPNPAWFILTIGTTGNGRLVLSETNSANQDVDFALYGPFTNAGAINCNNLGAPIDCSFDIQAAETITITGAVAGQAYVLLLTNYSNSNTTINMNQTGGTAGLGGPFNVTSAGPFLVTSAPVNLATVPATSDPNVTNENFAGPGITNASLGTFSPAVAGLGVHAVTATANTFGCAATDVVNITVSCPTIATPTPTANPFEACSGASATLSVTALAGATVTWYANSSGGTALGTGTSFTTPALSNNTTYYVEQSNLAGCASPRVAVQVNIQTTPSVSILPNTLNICTGGTALLTANPNPLAGTYTWSSTAQTTQSVSVNPAATTVYVVTFTSTAGCTATSNATVTVGSSAPIGLCTNFYVTTGGTSGGSGTQADPVTLARALTLGACQNAVIKVATGTYTLSGPIDIPSGVVIEGGFDPLTWEKTSLQGATTIRRTTSGTYPYDGAAGAPALIAFRVNSSANFRLQDLTITTDNAPAAPANSPGVSTFGLHLVGASNYDIVRCQITAGTAGAGTSGVAGAAGTTAGGNGGNGGNGDPDNESLLRAGGASGSSACGCAGGTGGTNSNVNFYAGGGFAGACGGGTNGGNTNGSANAPNGTGTGFGGGSGGDGCNFFGCTNPGTGGTGGAGAQGTAGTAGTAGPAGTFNAAGLFVPGRGTDGGNGGCGTGGGGGGGGGAESGGLCNDGSGGSGGGGGGGGTGGFGGTGAWGGGAAVAVMLVNNGTGGNFTDCNVIAGTGGAGGSGGTGGTGATGGTGGTGGWGGNCDVGRGGNGGNGGRGGSGGSGGNGAAGLGLAINTVGGTAPTTSNINLNLAAQPVIFKTNINCTNVATNYRSSGAAGTWDFGTNSNPQNQTGGAVNVTYSSLGRRNVIFNGNTYTGFQNVSFNGTAIPNIVLSGATNIGANSYQVCQGATLGLQSDQTGTSYTWDLGGANANPGNVQVIPASVFNTTGTFVIGLTVTNDCCGPVAAQSITLFVDPIPNPTITPNATICAGGQQTISLSGLNGGEVITWSPITNIVSQSPAVNPTSITVNPSNTTIYTALIALSTGGRAACSVNRSHTITVSAPLTASTSTTNTSCSAGGSATAIPANGTGAYTYNWANTGGTVVGNTQTISAQPAGNYFVTITDTGSGCTVSTFANIGIGAGALIASVQNQTSLACFGGNNAAVTLTASGGTAPYSFTWSAGPNGAVRTGLSAGSYTVTASDNSGGGCTATVTVFVGQPSEVSITLVSQTDPTSCVTPNGSITVAASGGTSPYIYSWTPTSGNLATATGLAAGSHDVFATDANGCTVAPINIVLGNPPPPFAGITPSTGTLTCVNATITLTAFAASGSTYLWGDGSTASSFAATVSGTQVLTVTDTNGCTATASALINSNTTQPNVSITPSTAVLDCINTSVTLTASSSTAGVAYNWGGGNNTTSQVVSTASVRGVTVTNPSNGCTASTFATLTSNTAPPAAAVAPATANLSCSVLSATLTASPSSGVSYNWGGANTNATLVVNAPGTYPVTITDNTNGCTSTANATVTQTTTPPMPSLAGNTSLCLTNSSNYTLSTSYTSYAWNVLGGNIVSGGNASSNSASVTWNTPGAGTVQVTVTDTNGCTASTSLSVNVNSGISVSNVLTACNVAGTQYSLVFDISGGTPAYNVVGTGGGIAANRFTSNPINAGTSVTVSITDAGGCPAVVLTRSQVCATPAACVPNNGCLGSNLVLGGDFETFNPASPFANFTSQYDYTNAPGVCTNTNGQNILCQYDFGVATSPTPYNPTWSSNIRDHTTGTGNMMIIDFPTGISSQIWCQTVTLAPASDYCFGTYAINLLPSTSPFTPPVFRFTANGTNLGNSSPVLATEQWGFYGYTFNSGVGGSTQLCIWNDNFGPNGYDLAIDDISIRQQLPGTPPIAADDSFALCQGSTSATGNVLSNDTPNGSPIVTVRVISAPAFSDGQVTLNNAGDFTFIPASTFGTSTTFDYEIVQASGCYDFGRVTITANANPTVTLSPINASVTCATTSVSITANGANAYVWNDNSSNNSLSVSAAGTYTVTGTSVNGCTASASVNVGSDLTPPTATITPISSTITCVNTNVTLTASGGVGYNWGNGTSLSTLQVGTQGNYLVTVTGSNGCTATTSATVTEDITPPVASINPSAASVTCANPTQVLTASGGSSYLWSNGLGNTTSVTATAGQFTVTVTAANGCTATASSTVTSLNVQPTFTTTTTNTSCFGNCDGNITIVPTAGTAPFSASWSNGSNGLTNSGLCAGAYDFTLTDASGCTTRGSGAVSGPSNPLTVDANSNTIGTCGTLCNGSALAVATGGTLPYTFLWSNGQAATNATGLCDGNAFVTVTDANGCTAIGSTNVPFRQTNQPTISFNSPLCEGQRAEFETQIYNGQTVVYDWAFNGSPVGSNSNTFAVSSADLDSAGIYSVTVTVNGCPSVPTSVTLVVAELPTVVTLTGGGLFCEGVSATLTAVTGSMAVTTTLTYDWTGPGGFTRSIQSDGSLVFPALTVAQSGRYTVRTRTPQGCLSNTYSVDIQVQPVPTAPDLTLSNAFLCEGEQLVLSTPSVQFIQGGYFWFHNGVALPASLVPNTVVGPVTLADAGRYQLQVNVNGCFSPLSGNRFVTVSSAPAVTPTVSSPVCVGAPVSFSAGFSAGLTYDWSGPLGFSGNTASPGIASATVAQSGTYYLVATDRTTGCATTASVTLQVNATPATPAAANSGPACAGSSVDLTLAQGGTFGANYTWLDATTGATIGTSTAANGLLSTSLPAGTYNFAVYASVGGCSGGISQPTTVTVRPAGTATAFAGPDFGLCGNTSTILTAFAPQGVLGIWSTTGSATIASPTSPNSPVTGLVVGVNRFTWTLTGCDSGSDILEIIVSDPVLDRAFAGSDQSLCGGVTTANLSARATSVGVPGRWDQVNGPLATIVNQNTPSTVVTGLQPGRNVFVWSVNGGACGQDSRDSVVLEVLVPLVLSVSDEGFTLASNIPSLNGQSVASNEVLPNNTVFTLISGTSQGTLEFRGDGSFDYARSSATIDYTETFTYRVCASDACGTYCDTAVVLLGVAGTNPLSNNAGCPFIPNIITPNGDNVNDALVVRCAGDLFPNGVEINIFNRYGDEVFNSKDYHSDWQGTFNGEPLPPGTYYYIVKTPRSTETVKGFFVIQR